MNEKLKQLHEALIKDNYAVPQDYSVFEKVLGDPNKSKEFHQKLVDSGYSVPTDYNQFSSVLGLGEKKKATPSEVSQPPSAPSGEPSSPGLESPSKNSVAINPTPEQDQAFQNAMAENAKTSKQRQLEELRTKSDESIARKVVNETAGEVERESNPFITMGKSAWNMLAYQIPSSILGAMSTMAENKTSFSQPNMLTKEQEASLKRTKQNMVDLAIKHGAKGEEMTKDLVSTMDKVKDPIDMLNWVSYAFGQTAAQIPLAVGTAGTSSIGQEVGSIYLDGVKKIAQDNNMTVEQVIDKKMDHPASALAFGTAAGMLDFFGAGKVLKIPKQSLLKSLRGRALEITKAGGTEAGTEYSQTWIEQIGKGEVAGNDLGKTWKEANTSEAARERLESAAQGLVGGSALHQAAQLKEDNIKAPEGDLGKINVQPKLENDALRQRSAESQVSHTGETRQNITESGEGVRPSEQRNGPTETRGGQTQEESAPHPPAPENGGGQSENEKVAGKIDDFAERLRKGEKFTKEEKSFLDKHKDEITKLARQKNVDELPFSVHGEEQTTELPNGEESQEEVRVPAQQPNEKPAQPASEEGTKPSETPAEPVQEPAVKEEVPVNKEGKQKLVVYGTLKDAHTRGEVFGGKKLSATPTELNNEQVTDIKGYPELEQSQEGKVKADVLEVTPKELEEAKNWEKGKYNLETVKLENGEQAYVFRLKPEAMQKLERGRPKQSPTEQQGKQVQFEWLGSTKRGVVIDSTDPNKLKIQGDNGKTYRVSPSEVSSLASKGGVPMSGFETKSEPFEEGKRFKIYEHVLDLMHKYNPNATVGQGMTGRKNKGLFYEHSKNIRLKGLNDLSVAMHELTHALDKGHGIIKKFISDTRPGDALRRELNKIYLEYYPNARANHDARTKAVEGYATLVQKYIETPAAIKHKYPTLVDAFLNPNSPYGFPALQEFLKDVESTVTKYQQASPLDKIGSRVVDNRIDEVSMSKLSMYDKVTKELFDRLAPIEKLDEEAGRNMTSEALHLWMRLSNNAAQLAEKNTTSKHHEFWQMDEKGEWKKKLDYNFNSLINDLDKRGEQQDFAHYLVARRVHEQYQALNELKSELATDPTKALEIQPEIERLEQIIANDAIGEQEAKAAFDEGQKMFKEDEKKFDALMDENLEFLRNPLVQLLDEEGYNKLKDVKGYAPFKRAFYDELTGDIDTPVMTSGKTRVGSLMGRHGSSKPIINPLVSAMNMHSEVLRKGMKQMVYNKVLGIAKEHPDMFQEMALETGPQGNVYPQERNPDVIMARRDYKRVPILVSREIKSVIDENYQYNNMHLLEYVGASMAQLFRTGTTGIFWEFFINNTFLDQIAATVNTRNGMMPFWSSFKQAFPAMSNLASERIFGKAIWFPNSPEAAYLKEYLFLAGSTQTFLNADITNRQNMEKTVIGGEKTFKDRVGDYFKFLLQMLSVPGNVTEIATRFTEYSLARKAGKSQIVALEEAGRVSAPFHHMGALKFGMGRSAAPWIRSVPYFNASLQVLKQMERSLKTPEGRKRYAFVTLSMLAASTGTVLHLLDKDDDDEQKQILKTLGPDELSKFLYMPNPYSDKRLLKIRIPEQMGWLSAMANMMLIQGANQTDYKWSEFGEAGASFLPTQLNPFNPTQMLFSYVPPAAKTAAESVLGMKTYPTVRPIETEHDKGLPKELRFNKYTSPVAIALGERFDMSPKKIDHFLEGVAGRSIKYLTGKPGVYNVDDIFSKELYFEASRQVQLYYSVKERNGQQIKAYEAELKDYPQDQVNLMYEKEDLLLDIEAAMQDYSEIKDDELQYMQATQTRNGIFQMLRQLENLEYKKP